MKYIDDKIKEYFITCGIKDKCQLFLRELHLFNYDVIYIQIFKNGINEYGVLKHYINICTKCFNIIKPKKKKRNGTANNSSNNNCDNNNDHNYKQ